MNVRALAAAHRPAEMPRFTGTQPLLRTDPGAPLPAPTGEGASAAAPSPSAPLPQAEVQAIIRGLLLAMLLAALDQTIVATALPTIGAELGDVEHLPWVVTAYLLASTAVTPLYGRLADIHGRRIMLLAGVGVFLAGSVACALAPTMPVLILARALQGLGGGGLIALAQTVIADLVPPRERARYQAWIASVFVTSSLAGPLLGGMFAAYGHWSFIFWINLPLGAAALAMTASRLKALPPLERRRALDLPGAALIAGASVSLLLALGRGGAGEGWGSPGVLGLFAASAGLAGGFAWRLRTAREPLIPPAVLADPVVANATLAACFGMGSFIGLTMTLPLYFEGALGFTASRSGFALIPFMIGTVTGATISGRVLSRVERYKRIPLAGLGMSALASLTLALALPVLPFWGFEALLTLVSLGLGTLLPISTVCVQNAVPPHELGTATAAMNFFRQIGGAVLVAVFGAIILRGGGETLAGGLGGLDPSHAADLAASFRWVFAAASACLAASFAFLAAVEERPLRGAVEAAAAE